MTETADPSVKGTAYSGLRLLPIAPYVERLEAHTMRSILHAVLASVICTGAHAQDSSQAPLDCRFGPFSKTFGATPWLVYGCADNKSVVVFSAPNSPAAPFYFMLFQKDGRYAVVGEGTGPKAVTDRTYEELVRLSDAQIGALHAAAKAATKR